MHEFFSCFLKLLLTYILADSFILNARHLTYQLRVDEIEDATLNRFLMFFLKDINYTSNDCLFIMLVHVADTEFHRLKERLLEK